ncbi:M56 family metallopeptidase [Roseimaritima ulvae]|uniref:Regulatory protein BlaR1 n=1 Tax=Roseimaritima ulvae TaxID=980254 RepID=A0A5B9QJJ1_9BACT|nr:M56 family metallopeptidase [Roseimaritima ulvae]QEG39287.1 Regulatory protein BlaR1 [Roseimaritima ulvae]
MMSPQAFVIGWLEYAAAATILLTATKVVVARLREPIDRANLIVMSLLAAAFVPLLLNIELLPSWHIGLLPANSVGQADTQPTAETDTASLIPSSTEHSATRPSAAANRPQEDDLAAGAATTSGSPRVAAGAEPWPTAQRADLWSVAAMLLILSHAAAIVWFAAEWIIGTVRLRRMTQRASKPEQAALDVLHEVSAAATSKVRLRVSDEISTPLVFGWRRPMILIPDSMASGDRSTLRYCLAHESSHVTGRDLGVWRLVNLCQFVLWYQPLYWALRRELRICQDLVADDRAAGTSSARLAYSELLLSLSKRPANRRVEGAIAFYDRSSQLSRRIRMLLDSSHSLRSRSPRRFLWMSGLLLLCGALLLGSLKLNAAGADEVRQAAAKTAPAGQTAEQDQQVKVVRGRVVDEAGQPIAGAQLWLPLQYQPRRCVQTSSDAAGEFELKCPVAWIRSRSTGSMWTVWVHCPGYSIQSQSVFDTIRGDGDDEGDEKYTIRLPAESTTRFQVLTPTGQPLANVLVQPQNYQTTVGYDAVPEEMLSVVSARTDQDGVATLPAIQSEPLFLVQLQSERYGRQTFRVDGNTDVPDRKLRLRETASIQGRLVGENPEWLRGVRLTLVTDNRDAGVDPQGLAEVVTDDAGRFEVPVIAKGGPLHIYVKLDPSLPVRPRLQEDLYLAAGETLQMEIPLVAAPVVRGKVLAKSTGEPIAGAEISLGYGGFRQSDVVVTDKRGEYQGRVLSGPVRAHIIVLPGDFVQTGTPWNKPYQVPADEQEFELPTIEVVGTRRLAGQLVGGQDLPLANRSVMAVEGNRVYDSSTSDAAGHFTLKVPDGVDPQIKVSVKDRGLLPTTVVQQDPLIVRYTADVREQEMEAQRASKADVVLTGRVFSEGEPIADIPILLYRDVPVLDSDSTRYEQVFQTQTDASGSYRLTGLKAGDGYSVEIKPPFLAADPTWLHQSPYIQELAGDADGEVALPDAKLVRLNQSLAGTVVDQAGQPVEGATVSVRLRGGRNLARLTTSGPPPWTKTNAQGRFHLKELPDQPLSIMVYIANPQGGRIRFHTNQDVERNQQDIHVVFDTSQQEEETP